MSKQYAVTVDFTKALGLFYGAWATLEMTVDFAIGRHLRLTDEETHLLTAAMEFSRKIILLKPLIKRNRHPKQTAINKSLNAILNDSKRNVFAHSFIRSDDDSVTFVERTTHGQYKAREHRFTASEFKKHVLAFTNAGNELHQALGYSHEEFDAFADAAISAVSSAATSPTPPNSTA